MGPVDKTPLGTHGGPTVTQKLDSGLCISQLGNTGWRDTGTRWKGSIASVSQQETHTIRY